MTTQLNINSLRQVVNDLLKANNTCTTLEVKNELRKREPGVMWNQADVSNLMDILHQNGVLTYRDQGTYRVYSLATAPANKPNPANGITAQINSVASTSTPKVKKPKAKPILETINRRQALKIIQATNNKFFGVTFIKKDGTSRKMVCRLDPMNLEPDFLGYLKVIDTQDHGIIKNLNMQTLSEIRVNNHIYTVK